MYLPVCLPEPPEYEAQDISVRVMSPQSVLISWVDPAVEMGKISPGESRWDLLNCVLVHASGNETERRKERQFKTKRVRDNPSPSL